MAEDPFNFVGLFDANTEADGVDGRFDEDAFGRVATDEEGGEEDFRGRAGSEERALASGEREGEGGKGRRGEGGETNPASISATLCRSATWEGKDSRVRAAVRDDRTQARYGRRVLDWAREGGGIVSW